MFFDVLKNLIFSLLDVFKKDEEWSQVYSFVADRFRAIRHDLIVQDLAPQLMVFLLEPMIPFYLEAKIRCEQLKTNNYDKKLHSSEIAECFSRWISAAKKGAKVDKKIITAYAYFYLDKNEISEELFHVFGFNDFTNQFAEIWIDYFNVNYCQIFRFYAKLDSNVFRFDFY